MKITDRFVGDHKTFRKLIKDINSIAGQPAEEWDQQRLVRLVELFKDHLVIHAWGEETFYYPAVGARLSENGPLLNKTTMALLNQEHQDVDSALDQLERQVKANPISQSWPLTYQTFVSGLVAHMHKEETELFPFSEGLLGVEGLERISNEMEQHRREAPVIRRHTSWRSKIMMLMAMSLIAAQTWSTEDKEIWKKAVKRVVTTPPCCGSCSVLSMSDGRKAYKYVIGEDNSADAEKIYKDHEAKLLDAFNAFKKSSLKEGKNEK